VNAHQTQAGMASTDASGPRRCPDDYRVVAIVEYDGTEYFGFQIQRRVKTIQGEIEQALAEITRHETRIVGAGRTDSGVHARGQVVHFAPTWDRPLSDLQRALNAVLPRDIAVVGLKEGEPGFHARYSAHSREYRYTILNRPVRSPLALRYAHHCAKRLDVQAMDGACASLVGTHDFLAFGWPPRGDNTVRTVLRAACARAGEFVRVDIEGDAFLRRMVRRIVGNLMLVGLGNLSVRAFADLLSLGHRRTPATQAPASGLCLMTVNY